MRKSKFSETQSSGSGRTLKVAAYVKRLRELEAENAKLKRMYPDLALENAAIKDVLSRKL